MPLPEEAVIGAQTVRPGNLWSFESIPTSPIDDRYPLFPVPATFGQFRTPTPTTFEVMSQMTPQSRVTGSNLSLKDLSGKSVPMGQSIGQSASNLRDYASFGRSMQGRSTRGGVQELDYLDASEDCSQDSFSDGDLSRHSNCQLAPPTSDHGPSPSTFGSTFGRDQFTSNKHMRPCVIHEIIECDRKTGNYSNHPVRREDITERGVMLHPSCDPHYSGPAIPVHEENTNPLGRRNDAWYGATERHESFANIAENRPRKDSGLGSSIETKFGSNCPSRSGTGDSVKAGEEAVLQYLAQREREIINTAMWSLLDKTTIAPSAGDGSFCNSLVALELRLSRHHPDHVVLGQEISLHSHYALHDMAIDLSPDTVKDDAYPPDKSATQPNTRPCSSDFQAMQPAPPEICSEGPDDESGGIPLTTSSQHYIIRGTKAKNIHSTSRGNVGVIGQLSPPSLIDEHSEFQIVRATSTAGTRKDLSIQTRARRARSTPLRSASGLVGLPIRPASDALPLRKPARAHRRARAMVRDVGHRASHFFFDPIVRAIPQRVRHRPDTRQYAIFDDLESGQQGVDEDVNTLIHDRHIYLINRFISNHQAGAVNRHAVDNNGIDRMWRVIIAVTFVVVVVTIFVAAVIRAVR